MKHTVLHPCVENPGKWADFRRDCWRRMPGCMHRYPGIGIKCGRKTGEYCWRTGVVTELNADHIKSVARYPHKKWKWRNLQTLCRAKNEEKGWALTVNYKHGWLWALVWVPLWYLTLIFRAILWVAKRG